MRIGIIGAGNIGGALTRRLTALGHEVAVANSRGPEACRPGGRDRGEGGRGPGGGAAARVVVVTIPQRNIPDLPEDLFAGVPRVVVVDTGNYYPQQRDGRIDGIEDGLAESRWVERQLGRPVVKAFNNIYAKHLLDHGRPAGTPGRIALPVAGDDAAAKAKVMAAGRRAGVRRRRRGRSGRVLAAAAGHAGLRPGPRRRGRAQGAGRGEPGAQVGSGGRPRTAQGISPRRLDGPGAPCAATMRITTAASSRGRETRCGRLRRHRTPPTRPTAALRCGHTTRQRGKAVELRPVQPLGEQHGHEQGDVGDRKRAAEPLAAAEPALQLGPMTR